MSGFQPIKIVGAAIFYEGIGRIKFVKGAKTVDDVGQKLRKSMTEEFGEKAVLTTRAVVERGGQRFIHDNMDLKGDRVPGISHLTPKQMAKAAEHSVLSYRKGRTQTADLNIYPYTKPRRSCSA